MGKIDNNKQMKRESLLDSAFSLFIDNGFNKTSISDIVNNAGVAKGTFCLESYSFDTSAGLWP